MNKKFFLVDKDNWITKQPVSRHEAITEVRKIHREEDAEFLIEELECGHLLFIDLFRDKLIVE